MKGMVFDLVMNNINTSIGISGRKVAIIGVGYVGTSIAYALTIKGIAREIVLIEHPDCAAKCVAEINDIRHGIRHMGLSNVHYGTYADIKDCNLIVIAAGRNRRPGETRPELAADNLITAKHIAVEIRKHYTKGVVLIVTNPVDTITQAMTQWLALPDGTVFSTGCLLDSSRLTNVVADFIGLSPDDINALIIGEHGDGQIAIWSKVTVAGISIKEYCEMIGVSFTNDDKTAMEQRVRTMGTEIIKGKGRTHYGIATCVCYIADAILDHRPTIASVSSVLHGEYGISNVALSLPCIIDSSGIKRRLTDKLENVELARLKEVAKMLASSSSLIDK